MTTAKFLTAPAKGHGLTEKITDPMYRALTRNESPGEIVAIVVLRPKSFGATDTADGRHQHLSFEAAKVEPVLDVNQANELRYLLQALYEQRTSRGEQKTLPLGLGGDREKQLALIERIEDWSGERGMTGGELDALWRETFGIGPDQDWSLGDTGIPGDYRKAGYPFLLEFAGKVGAVNVSGDATDDPDDDASDEGEKPEADVDADAADETDEGDPAVGVTCQVCGKKKNALYDGLCAKCAKNAGISAPKVEDEAASA